jgi:hypothetical protein
MATLLKKKKLKIVIDSEGREHCIPVDCTEKSDTSDCKQDAYVNNKNKKKPAKARK